MAIGVFRFGYCSHEWWWVVFTNPKSSPKRVFCSSPVDAAAARAGSGGPL
ncbi:hypothetical protein HanPI659440_Chr13g0504031 [Helianthus annuus]|nr:hypothetical protein HanPI659440_Chr13g0504031 [Helianthus annuus]